MSIDMKQVSEKDLAMLYYGEHQNPGLALQVAQSEELSARFKALSAELEMVDSYQPPERGEEYGADVWQRIAPHLELKQSADSSAFQKWWSGFIQPRFSPAGMFGIALIAVLAFTLGRNGTDSVPAGSDTAPSFEFAGIDSGRLLQSSVSSHLGQLNVVLTEFAHTQRPAFNEAQWAMDMLVANRLYRQSAAAKGNQRLSGFLAGIEPLLIELAYEAHRGSNTARERMQKEVRDDLLFKIRVMNSQLKTTELST
jgi:hypothetical protein